MPQALIVGGHERNPILPVSGIGAALGIAVGSRSPASSHPRQVPALLARADILALPNPPRPSRRTFTSPLKLFEYMAAGRAIVASDLPSIREVLQP